ncbi:unnamed protein product [Paramecium octaurelia]|uniref:Clathrin light chain n=1 Tax=Paramecium octaurelia TaxID=43137 RepID=A0A8S1UYV2_PAROT|nr:unnamed protein product [Paramecium octaurelia]
MYDFFEESQTEKQNVHQDGLQGEQIATYDAFSNETSTQPITLNTYVSPEQQQRKDKLRILEDERKSQIREKDQQERVLKQQKKQKGQEFLQEFKKQQEMEILQRRGQNQQKQEILNENQKHHNQYKNSWDQIASNIALKDGEYPGVKDVTKMRQAILNKRINLTK